ncbi:ferrichrome-iron receptor domain protein [Lysobacter antibioticus]|nr:ferrichrome-iron receptor domain protein [Lysobacter antibioticus]
MPSSSASTPPALPRAIRLALFGLPLLFGAFAAHAVEAGDANDPTTLDEVQVRAPIARRSQTVTKTDTSLIEVPQSISVVTAQQMRDRGIQGGRGSGLVHRRRAGRRLRPGHSQRLAVGARLQPGALHGRAGLDRRRVDRRHPYRALRPGTPGGS